MKLKIKAGFCAAAMMSFGSAMGAADWTPNRNISSIIVTGEAYYATTTGGVPWGSAACPSATHLLIPRADAGSSQLLALLLSVKAAGTQIAAYGDCDGSPSYFHTNYIMAY